MDITNALIGPRQANLVLIAYASSEGSGEPAHPRSLARTSAARSYKQWVKRTLQTEIQIPGPSEWLGMRSYNLSWRNARRHKFAWRATINNIQWFLEFCFVFLAKIYISLFDWMPAFTFLVPTFSILHTRTSNVSWIWWMVQERDTEIPPVELHIESGFDFSFYTVIMIQNGSDLIFRCAVPFSCHVLGCKK